MRRARFLRRTGLDKPHPGGRWHRILRALEAEPMTVEQLYDATDPGQHPGAVERRKIKVALRDMGSLGLVERVAGWGWASTVDGRRTLADLDAQPSQGPAAAQPQPTAGAAT